MSKKLWIIIGSIIGALVIAGIIITIVLVTKNNNPIDDQYRSIIVEKLDGNVKVNRNDKDIDAYQNMNLRSGDTISTNNTSNAVLKLDGDKFVYIGENSNINLVSSEKDSSKTIIRVNEGSIVTEVKNKLSDLEEFGVETPNSTMAIRGTIFSVKVVRENNQIRIGYKLLEGNIELSIIEKTETGINVGRFSVKPMEEINILSKGDGILQKEALTDVLDKINKKDQTVVAKEYQTVEQYVSETAKIELVEKKLEVSDVEDILRNLPSNATNESIRLVTVNATFKVVVNGNESTDSYMKYDSKESFTVSIMASDSNKNVVGWLVNGEEVDGSNPFTYIVTKTTLIEPVYSENLSTTITVMGVNQTTVNVVVYSETETADTITIEDVSKQYENPTSMSLSYDSFEDTKFNQAFIGWYKLDPNDEYQYYYLSNEREFTFEVKESCTITPVFIEWTETPELYLVGQDGPITSDSFLSLETNREYQFYLTSGSFGNRKIPLSGASFSVLEGGEEINTQDYYIERTEKGIKLISTGSLQIYYTYSLANEPYDQLEWNGGFYANVKEVMFSLNFDSSTESYYEASGLVISKANGEFDNSLVDSNGIDTTPSILVAQNYQYSWYEFELRDTDGNKESINFNLDIDTDKYAIYRAIKSGDDAAPEYTLGEEVQPNNITLNYLLQDGQDCIIIIDKELVTGNMTGINPETLIPAGASGISEQIFSIIFTSIPS